MKKALSLFLAILMLCGALSVGSFAADETVVATWNLSDGYFNKDGSTNKPANQDQIVAEVNLNGGKLVNSVYIITDNGTVKYTNDVPQTYILFPFNAAGQIDPNAMRPASGGHVDLPKNVEAPNGKAWIGWEIWAKVGQSGEMKRFTVTAKENWVMEAKDNIAPGQVVQINALFNTVAEEEDTLSKVMGILCKIFGAILGIIMFGGDTEQGIAMMNKIIGGIGI